jgi:hypothetical protein
MAVIGVSGNSYVGFAFEALEGDGEQLVLAGCESGYWLWGGHFGGLLLLMMSLGYGYGWVGGWSEVREVVAKGERGLLFCWCLGQECEVRVK